jgi:predicted DNA-binding transcriptional regulator AlpA
VYVRGTLLSIARVCACLEKLYCTAAQVRRRYGGISEMGLWRWINDGKVDFPKPDLIVNGRRLWSEETLDIFDARLAVREAEAA